MTLREDAEVIGTGGAGDHAGAGTGVVSARLIAGVDRLSREGRAEQSVPLDQAPTVTALCETLGVDVGIIGLVLVNGVHGDIASALHDGDEVSLFPPVGGG